MGSNFAVIMVVEPSNKIWTLAKLFINQFRFENMLSARTPSERLKPYKKKLTEISQITRHDKKSV